MTEDNKICKKDRIIALYHDTPSEEICKIVGVKRKYVTDVASRYHLTKSDEAKECDKRIRSEKIHRALIRSFKMERFRILSGEPQRTKRFLEMNKRQRYIRNHLVTKFNYIVDTNDPERKTFIYDELTKRSPREYLYVKRYGYHFVKADN